MTRKTPNSTLAAVAALLATPVDPNTPAMIEITMTMSGSVKTSIMASAFGRKEAWGAQGPPRGPLLSLFPIWTDAEALVQFFELLHSHLARELPLRQTLHLRELLLVDG